MRRHCVGWLGAPRIEKENGMSFWESFGDLLLWTFWFVVFIAYLMVLFSILADIFRDESLNGWVKAVWVILLVFVPFLTALVYLIVRGKGMAERNATQIMQQKDAADAYIRTVAGSSPVEEIDKANTLRDDGTITEAEFEAIKSRALMP
jgi:uncharacterized membrane protein